MKCSASSFETAKDQCMRKWWFSECRDMPIGKVIAGSDFGTAIHGVNERWRRADDLGNLPAGIELYPAGWNAGLDDADSVLVKLLHEKAVEQGVLVRRKGRKPEEWMNRPIIVDDDVVQLTGKLDCEDEEGFEDDKSSKDKKWTKDEEGLSTDAAMMFYAVEWCMRHADAVKCRMRYNYFLKDPSAPKTWPVEAIVTREVVDHFKQNELLPTVRAMLAVHSKNLPDEAWEQVEGPKSQDACRAFGGCPFATMCGRVEQPAQYRARVARILSNRSNKEQPVGIFANKGASAPAPAAPAAGPVAPPAPPAPAIPSASAPAAPAATPAPAKAGGGIFARKNSTPPASPPTTPGQAAPVTTAPAAPSTPPAQAGAVQAPPTPPAAPATPPANAMPWAHPGCKACKGTGIHPTEKRPCKGCRSTRMVTKQPTDESFDITWNADGSISWKAKEGVVVPNQAAPAGTAPVIAPVTAPVQGVVPTVTEPVEKKVAKPRGKKAEQIAADVQAPAAPAPTVQAQADAEQVAASIQEDAARQGLPLILLCGVFPEKLPAYYRAVSMADVFAEAAGLVAEASGKPFFEINAFERRDALAKMAPELADRLKAIVLVCPRSTPDVDALVQALKPHAGIVLAGLS